MIEAASVIAGGFIVYVFYVLPDYGDEKHHGPRRGEPHILLLMAAEGLDLIDVGHLERQHGEQGDAKDGGEVIPCEGDRTGSADWQTPVASVAGLEFRRWSAGPALDWNTPVTLGICRQN